MAQIKDDSGGKTDFWKAPDFKDKVKKIRERDEAFITKNETKPIVPGVSFGGVRTSKTRRDTEEVVREQVTKEINAKYKTPTTSLTPSSTSNAFTSTGTNAIKAPETAKISTPKTDKPTDIQKLIDEEVKRRLPPRYVMTADGRPFYISKEDERTAYEQSLVDETEGRKKWMLFKYDVANTIASSLAWASEPSLQLKELFTDKDRPNALGAIAQLGYNTAIAGVEYIQAGAYNTFVNEDKKERLQKLYEAAKYTDPQKALSIQNQIKHLDRQLEFKETINERLAIAKQAIKESWAQLEEARDANVRGEGAPAGYGPEAFKRREEYFNKLREEEAVAKAEATALRSQATQAYAEGNYEQAVQLTKQAQDADRRGDPLDSYGAYTWIRQPERYDKFLEDAALVEIQKGAPLTQEEIRRLKEYHTNGDGRGADLRSPEHYPCRHNGRSD
jgi:hypothetical protein